MIPLRLASEAPPNVEPIIVRLREASDQTELLDADAILTAKDGEIRDYDFQGFRLRLKVPEQVSLDRDVLLIPPGRSTAHRLIRADSHHNTLLVTERCDQLCVMCSQPPKEHHTDVFPLLEQAALLAPVGATIGLSGGEPTLYFSRLIEFLGSVSSQRPDLRFHVLSNGQHFRKEDIGCLRALPNERLLWGVPIYSADPGRHDSIVGKEGAFQNLMQGFEVLLLSGAAVELRTVVMRDNVARLPDLARFMAARIPFVAVWGLMQLENIGFGRMNWSRLFYDSSLDFQPVGNAVSVAAARGIEVALYNFPLCSVPEAYRGYAVPSISDWKRRYLDSCSGCRLKEACGGFFSWYREEGGFSNLGVL